MFASNRGTNSQIVVLSNPSIVSENILTLGQSGFVRRNPADKPELDPHFNDQLELNRWRIWKSSNEQPPRMDRRVSRTDGGCIQGGSS